LLQKGGELRRDFGSVNHNHTPIGGYQQPPHHASERGNMPPYYPRQQAPQAGRFFVAEAGSDELAGFEEFEAEFRPLGNPDLPVSAYRQEIADAVETNPVTIVVGATGSGKSTQIPQILLEREYSVSVSQPRRLAARMVAERIGDELADVLGPDQAAGLVGFQTAERSTVTDNTRITVLTDGIEALRQLNQERKPDHVYMIDEVHEWNANLELTVAMIKRRVAEDPSARFVLTSATMDAHRLAAYFASATGTAPPVIEVPGRTHDIEHVEKPGSTVADEVIASATKHPDEDILVFVPGKREILDTIDTIYARLPKELQKTATVLPLHAKLSAEDQKRITEPTKGLKIIVSTNVAQTSLTIDGVGVVVDSGLERRIELDEEGVEGLCALPVSQADCDQRAGRTGRVGPGKYILTRYDDKAEFVSYMSRSKYPVPEILRSDLDGTTLRAAAVGINLADLELFHAVDPEAIRRSQTALYNIGALDAEGTITRLGARMSEFPVRPSSARMLMEALPYSDQVRSQLAAIVAAIEVGGLPYFAPNVGRAWKELTEEQDSDLLAQLDLFIATQSMTDVQLTEYNLDVQNVHRAQELYGKIMHRGHVGEAPLLQPTDEERGHIEQAICAGLIDLVYQRVGDGEYNRVSGRADPNVRQISNRSVVGSEPRLVVGSPYCVERWQGGRPYTRHIIEGITAIHDPSVLGKVAAEHLLSWEPERQVWRDGKLHEVLQRVFAGTIRIGETMEAEAADTPQNHDIVRDSLLDLPGSAQRELRGIKRELERLSHLTLEPVPQLTQDALIGLVEEAMAVAGGYDQPRIDAELRTIMEARGLTIDAFVSPQRQQAIQAAAPADIAVASGVRLGLKYYQGTPLVTDFTQDDIARCSDDVHLPDGREVMFWRGRRRMSLTQVRGDLLLFDTLIVRQ
jgi:ATP-dependent helicase HrpA